mgnify:CR=1 FL=1
MNDPDRFLREHIALTRRFFLQVGAGGLAIGGLLSRVRAGEAPSPELSEALEKLESYLTMPDDFYDVSRGKPVPHSLAEEKKREVGLTRDTWRLEVVSDADHKVRLRKPMSQADGTAFDFAALRRLAETHAVRFPKVMTCLNIGCPLGMGIWEGVPLREILWAAQPQDNARRVYYYGYHNDDPKQMFRSSLPIGRVLEDPFDLPPVIACYKLNGQWLSPERGGPVRIVVPEAYGFKSIKWLSHVVLSSMSHANDTYAEQGNDIDSPLKTFAATLSVPRKVASGQKLPLTGYAQVGIGGLSKVQVWIQPEGQTWPRDDRYFDRAPWVDMQILPPPDDWGGGLPDERIPANTLGFESSGTPAIWPMRLCKAHWAGVHDSLSPGKYTLRCRAVDAQGHGQPMPRPFRKSGHAAIEQVEIVVR